MPPRKSNEIFGFTSSINFISPLCGQEENGCHVLWQISGASKGLWTRKDVIRHQMKGIYIEEINPWMLIDQLTKFLQGRTLSADHHPD